MHISSVLFVFDVFIPFGRWSEVYEQPCPPVIHIKIVKWKQMSFLYTINPTAKYIFLIFYILILVCDLWKKKIISLNELFGLQSFSVVACFWTVLFKCLAIQKKKNIWPVSFLFLREWQAFQQHFQFFFSLYFANCLKLDIFNIFLCLLMDH